ncbi:unnamed protein product [Cyprideis torosa]|uniref:PROP1-like PPR domain-containing protein n=1 Tax=Cyprideis torosa TaxID=163714 RepID=A0A7R8WG99_9CRUS|nr:unnamed protein product [Cyprideis torosa]CAG0892386.1 unnamed protein product [Cyprideis torosa]
MSSMRGLLCRFSVLSCSSRPGPVLQKCSSVLVRPQESPWRPTCSVREASQRMWDREEKPQGTRAQRDEGRGRERYPSDVRTTRFKTRPREQGFGVGLKPFAFGELSGGGDPSASADHIHEEDEVSERPAQIRPPHKYHKKIVHLLKEQKNLKAALSVLDEMKEDGKEPDRSTLSLLMGGCSQFGYLDKCLELFKQLMETEVRRPPPSAYTSLFNACANSFDKESALVAAKRIQRDMEVRLYIPNRPIFHAMIKAYSRCGDLHGALGVVDLMVGAEHGLQPTDETFNFLFQGCVEDKGEGFRHALMFRPFVFCWFGGASGTEEAVEEASSGLSLCWSPLSGST